MRTPALPWKPFRQTKTTVEQFTALIFEQETPHRVATHRYRIEIYQQGREKPLTTFYRFSPGDAVNDAENWQSCRLPQHPTLTNRI